MYKYSPPSSQDLVDAPLATITALSLCGLVSIRLIHLDTAILLHFLQSCSSSVRLHDDWAWRALFKSSHKFSIGLRSGLWLGHSRTFTLLSLNHFCVAFTFTHALCHCLAGKYIFSQVVVLLQTESDCSPGFPYILLHSLDPLPSQAFQGLLPKACFGLIRPKNFLPLDHGVTCLWANSSQDLICTTCSRQINTCAVFLPFLTPGDVQWLVISFCIHPCFILFNDFFRLAFMV